MRCIEKLGLIKFDFLGLKTLTTIADGAQAVAHLASSAELDDVTGEYFNGCTRASANPQAYERKARRQLRLLSDQLTGRNDAAADSLTKGVTQ